MARFDAPPTYDDASGAKVCEPRAGASGATERPAFSNAPFDGVAPDLREVSRVVATVLLASGMPSAEDIACANDGLARLGRPPLAPHDATPATPEELARLVPEEVRGYVFDLLLALAADDPVRGRVARAYGALWGRAAPRPTECRTPDGSGLERTAPPGDNVSTAAVARWLVGRLPRHHITSIPEDRPMLQHAYRDEAPDALAAPSASREPLRARVERIQDEFRRVVSTIDRVLLGKRGVVERVLTAMAARGHVLLVDAPGVGKTLLCKAIAAACGVRFGRVQFTPDLLPLDLTGASVYEAHEKRFVFRPGPLFTQFLLADEINRATPKTQSALLEVMEERTITVDGTTHRMAEPFQVLATMNPIEHEGTFPLPAAQIDRFMVMLELGYPAPEDEVRMLDTHLVPDPVLASIEPVLAADAFVDWQRTAALVHAAPAVKRAAVAYVDGLRRDAPAGAVSPRATLAWMRAAQARAMVSGRDFVTGEDLLDVSADVLGHRLWVGAAELSDRLRAIAHHGSRG
jgi:MoxR-like ATPase